MLTNAVVISVLVLCILCLVRVNVFLSLLISAITAGMMGGLGVDGTMKTLITGMGSNPETALSYVLLGAMAAAISYTGLADILAVKIAKAVNGRAIMFIITIAIVSCFSQNLIPVHIAFIPILIPPLLVVMNKMKLDRRAVACALAYGLKAPYIAIPAGFGFIYHGIVAKNMSINGMPIETMDVWRSTWTIGAVMFLGFLLATFIGYRKAREYKDIEGYAIDLDKVDTRLTSKHVVTLLAALSTLVIQIIWIDTPGSLALGAIFGLSIMFLTKTIKWSDMDEIFNQGVNIMGFIAFVMLASEGYSVVVKETGAVKALIEGSLSVIGNSKFLGALVMMSIGLVIVMGTGTSFGTVPVIAVFFVPLSAALGFSVPATIILLASAAAIGDAGSPVSDTTLGPTAGLNADGQHDHIWDTCVPTFIYYNIPIFIWAVVAPLVL